MILFRGPGYICVSVGHLLGPDVPQTGLGVYYTHYTTIPWTPMVQMPIFYKLKREN